MAVSVDSFDVADPPEAWAQAGFTVEDGVCRIGAVSIRLLGREPGKGIVGWSLRDLPPDAPGVLDGVRTTRATTAPPAPATHANGATSIDHVVLLSPHLRRTVDALAAVGVARAGNARPNWVDDGSSRSSSASAR